MAIRASAPVRICDIGGWTDTWFGGPGRVFNVAVAPGAEVTIREADLPDPVVLDVPAYGDRYPVVPGAGRAARHPLLEAAVDLVAPPGGAAVEIVVRCGVPPGCGAGTSAAVTVALLGALWALRTTRLAPLEVARAAHRIETGVLGSESGVQDQLSSAMGGINFIEVDHYPDAVVHRLADWDELGPLLVLVYVGRAHDSSSLHRQVIEGTGSGRAAALDALRAAAVAARQAAVAGDVRGLGRAMAAGTEAQRALLPGLVGSDALRVIALARSAGALGWKVNGAGGDGGSLTLLCATPEAGAALAARVEAADRGYRVLPVTPCPDGLCVRTDFP